MRITSRGFTAVTVGLVSAVLLVGCSSDSTKPTVLPPLTSSSAAPTTPATTAAPTPTAALQVPSPTTAAPSSAQPAETATATGKPHNDSGARADATKFIKTYFATADATLHNKALLPKWRSLFIDTCALCLSDYTAIGKELRLGSRYEGGGYQLKHISVVAASATDGARADIVYILPAAKLFDKNNKLIDSLGASSPRRASVGITNESGRLYITSLMQEAPK